MEYVCRVGTPSGEVVEREFSAPDERALRADLEQQGLYLLSVRRALSFAAFRLRKRHVDPSLLLVFAQELAALLKAGLPLFQSLDVMLERQRNPLLRQSLGAVREKVKSGTALSEAFRQEGDFYPPIFSASLVAGERSGNLDAGAASVLHPPASQPDPQEEGGLGLGLPDRAADHDAGARRDPGRVVSSRSSRASTRAWTPSCRCRRLMPAGAVGTLVRTALVVVDLAGACWACRGLAAVRGVAYRIDGLCCALPYFGGLMRMYATSQLMRTLSTLARRRPAAAERARGGGAVGRQPGAWRRRSAGPRAGFARAPA